MSCHVLTNLVLVAFLVVDLEPAALPPVVTDGVVCHPPQQSLLLM